MGNDSSSEFDPLSTGRNILRPLQGQWKADLENPKINAKEVIRIGRERLRLCRTPLARVPAENGAEVADFSISIERFDERATLLIHGKHSYRANVSDNPAGTIASLERALDSFDNRLREWETDLAQSRRQSADLIRQLDQPFGHKEKLEAATKRQHEIVTALDITKNQASARRARYSERGLLSANTNGHGMKRICFRYPPPVTGS
jgi:hypothetical protein